ncbi:MAG: hypothetical protein LLG06_19680 [Desulfobacteraceae bacterium]|nr:hypothetical protein [Desulfobacteraceae bacterium]
MARIRGLKPDFFKDEDLAFLPFEARLFFEGLWCHADREGRLEDRPRYLKAEIFPYDDVDVEKLLYLLSNPNLPDRPNKVFIRRYQVDEKKYIDIPEFLKHQAPHRTERNSILPGFNGYLTVNAPLSNVPVTAVEQIKKLEAVQIPVLDTVQNQERGVGETNPPVDNSVPASPDLSEKPPEEELPPPTTPQGNDEIGEIDEVAIKIARTAKEMAAMLDSREGRKVILFVESNIHRANRAAILYVLENTRKLMKSGEKFTAIGEYLSAALKGSKNVPGAEGKFNAEEEEQKNKQHKGPMDCGELKAFGGVLAQISAKGAGPP